MTIQSVDISGTVVGNSWDAKVATAKTYLTVRLEDGNTVQASVHGTIDYYPGRRVVLKETTSNVFGVKKHEF